mgnify:FL=1
MKTLRIKAAAKLNLSLDILGIRPDGYHEMDMVMQTIDLFDDVELSKAGTISVFSDGSPDGPENLVWKAAEAFFRAAKRSGGARIRLTKRIPAQAGMAGGSADAAAVLIGLNALYDACLSPEALRDAGLSVGADVPYCLIGGTARVRGIGEIVEPMPPFLSGYLVVAKPAIGISTAEAFRRFDRAENLRHPDIAALLSVMEKGQLDALSLFMENVLEQSEQNETVETLRQELLKNGALAARMTGSGSAVFGLFSEKEAASRCAVALAGENRQIFVTKPYPKGITLLP